MKSSISITDIYGVLYLLPFLVGAFLTVQAIRHKTWVFLWGLIPSEILLFFLLEYVMEVDDPHHSDLFNSLLEAFPRATAYRLTPFILIGILIFQLGIASHERLWRQKHITPQSIGEVLNSLSTGILCYYPNGKIVLLNNCMSELISVALENRYVNNGSMLCGNLLNEEISSKCRRFRIEGEPVIMLPDKRVYLLRQSDATIEGELLSFLYAFNITSEYNKTEELYEEQRKLNDLNEKLLVYNREIVDMIAAQEILNAKIKIHDSIGEELLMMRRIIEVGGNDEDKASVIEALNKSLSFILAEKMQGEMDEYEMMIGTAAELGVKVEINGKLPTTEPQKHIVATGIHICFTNTIRHAKGDRLFITSIEDERSYTIVYSNNGNQPAEEIQEKNGLQSLREIVEKAGGRMQITSLPSFKLTLILPKENSFL